MNKALQFDTIEPSLGEVVSGVEEMGMSDEQFQVFTSMINFVDELIDREKNEEEKEALKRRKKNILKNNKESA